MKVLPLFYLGSLSEEDIKAHECSDRIWVDHATFMRYAESEVGVASIVRLYNRVDQSVPALIYSPHSQEPNTIYAPSWMISELLHDTEEVNCERIHPSMATRISIVPHTSDHLRADEDPETILRNGFEQYTCLVKGMDYNIWLGAHSFTITLLDILPHGHDIYCIRGSELELELGAPFDRPVTPPPPETLPEPVAAASQSAPQQQPSEAERRAIIAAAARRRMEALRMPSNNS